MQLLTFWLLVLHTLVFCPQARGGYTHYFTWHQTPDEAAIKKCVAEMRLIILTRTNILAGANDADSPLVLEESRVDLNGIGDDAHEPFVFPGRPGFNFCKTAYKPYDEVVTACLIVARDHFPPSALAISSDGAWEDWDNGAKLYASVLKRPARDPMGAAFGSQIIPRTAGQLAACAVLILAFGVGWYIKKHRGY